MIGIILGAGLSTRMAEEKLLLKVGKWTLIEEVISRAEHSGIDEYLLVTKANILEQIKLNNKIKCIVNSAPECGQSASLKLGIRYASEKGHNAAVIFLGDQPLIPEISVTQCLGTWYQNSDKIVYPEYNNIIGHPVIIGQSWYDAFLNAQGDVGGKYILKGLKRHVMVIKGSHGNIFDIDKKDDYVEFLKTISKNKA
jgi:molybdenum cofactor cytidylyltransferase